MGDDHDHGMRDHSDEHPHEHAADQPAGRLGALVARLRELTPHDHGPVGTIADTGAEGIRATKVSLVGLGVTAALQAVIVVFTGSVALLSDTIHNLTDALTAVPLWIAFSLGGRPPSRRYTFGLHRAEDLAGLLILAAILFSAGAVAWESFGRLFEPRKLDYVGWVIAAGVVGALGNELVARYRIVVGRRISSEALVADGVHARTDALTSLAVVAAGLGALAGADWADAVAGLVVAVMILVLLRHSAARMFGRLLDAVEPELVDRVAAAAAGVAGVEEVTEVRARWVGHRLSAALSIEVDPALSVRDGHDIAQRVTHAIHHELPHAVDTLVHVDPHGEADESHSTTDHHRP